MPLNSCFFVKCVFFCYLAILFVPKFNDFFTIKLNVDAFESKGKLLMSGKVLRVVVIHYPPAVVIVKQPDGTMTFRGTSIGIMNYVAKALNISYEWIFLKESDVKKYGLGPAQMNLIINDEADITIFGLVSSISRYEVMDLTAPVLMEPYRLIVPWPKEQSRLLAPIRPFQMMVWIWLGLTVVVLAPVLTFFGRFFAKHIKKERNSPQTEGSRSIAQNAMFILSHLTNHSYSTNLRSRASYIAVGVWCLMAVVLANAYAGTLFSFLTVTKLEPIVNSLEELANSKQLQLLIQDRTVLADRLLEATNGAEKLIGDSLRANPENLIANLGQVKEKLVKGSYAFTYMDLFNYILINSTYYENNKRCLLTVSKEPVTMFAPIVFGLTKNGPFTQAISEQIQAQTEQGLIGKYIQNITPNVDQCKMENQKASSRQRALSLVDLTSAFIVLGLGLSLAFLVFLLEVIYKRIQIHRFA